MPTRVWSDPNSKYKYGFNGMEKTQEMYGDGNEYTTEYRQYDPRICKWLSPDPKMHLYPSMSSYLAYGDNPVLITDFDGDVLKVNGGAAEITKFKAMLQLAFGETIKVEVVAGVVKITGDPSTLDVKANALYSMLNTVILEAKTTDVYLLSEAQRNNSFNGTYEGATLDNKKMNTIDLYDMDKFIGQSITPIGLLTHEIWESYLSQTQGISFSKGGHSQALVKQGGPDGISVTRQWGDASYHANTNGKCYFLYTKDGKMQTLIADVKNNNVVSLSVQEGYVVEALDGKGTTTLKTAEEYKKHEAAYAKLKAASDKKKSPSDKKKVTTDKKKSTPVKKG